MTIQTLGGRRFILSVLTLLVCSVLLWNAKLSDGSFCAITLATVGALIAGHTYQQVKAKEAS